MTGGAWLRLFGPSVRNAAKLSKELLGPVVHVPRHPLALARFGLPALRSAEGHGEEPVPRGSGAGPVRRSRGALDPGARPPVVVLVRSGPGHVRPRRRLADGPRRVPGRRDRPRRGTAGGSAARSSPVSGSTIWIDLPPARAVLFDTTPRAVAAIAGDRLPAGTRASVRAFPLRLGRLQGGLGARRSHPLGRRGRQAGEHRPCWRHAG